jgi:hypothetical protein
VSTVSQLIHIPKSILSQQLRFHISFHIRFYCFATYFGGSIDELSGRTTGRLEGSGRTLLERLGFKQKRPTPIYEDNTACIEWGNNVIGGRERAKHIDIRKHFAHEVIQNGAMRLIKVPTALQLADILTKGLHLPQVLACVDGLLGRKSNSST